MKDNAYGVHLGLNPLPDKFKVNNCEGGKKQCETEMWGFHKDIYYQGLFWPQEDIIKGTNSISFQYFMNKYDACVYHRAKSQIKSKSTSKKKDQYQSSIDNLVNK